MFRLMFKWKIFRLNVGIFCLRFQSMWTGICQIVDTFWLVTRDPDACKDGYFKTEAIKVNLEHYKAMTETFFIDCTGRN